MPSPTYCIYKDRGGKFRFRLCASNGQAILSSQGYASKRSAENGVKSVKANARFRNRYELKKSGRGQPYFVLQAANGEVIGKSQMYSSSSSRSRGIKSVMANGGKAKVTYDL